MEVKLEELTKEINKLSDNKAEKDDKNINMEIILAIVGDFLENLA